MNDEIDRENGHWFRQAIGCLPKEHAIPCAGARLHVLEWGDRGMPSLLFIHGGAAHAGWWRFIAPLFLPDFHCVAVDLSGHGDSERRGEYPQGIWADEIRDLIGNKDVFTELPIVIGHSLGGLTGIRAAARTSLPGLIVIDAAVRPAVVGRRRNRNLLGRDRHYPDRQDVLDRFRLIPPQPVDNTEIVDYIAQHSIRRDEGGWTWKYDPEAFRQLVPVSLFDQLGSIHCATALIRGEFSRILDVDTARRMIEGIAGPARLIEIPDAHHHIMIDQPLLLVAEIRSILSAWL